MVTAAAGAAKNDIIMLSFEAKKNFVPNKEKTSIKNYKVQKIENFKLYDLAKYKTN